MATPWTEVERGTLTSKLPSVQSHCRADCQFVMQPKGTLQREKVSHLFYGGLPTRNSCSFRCRIEKKNNFLRIPRWPPMQQAVHIHLVAWRKNVTTFSHLKITLLVNQKVFWLQVSIDNVEIVQVLKTEYYLRGVKPGVRFTETYNRNVRDCDLNVFSSYLILHTNRHFCETT